MLTRFRPRLSYANVMSTIAAFLALATGGAYAANTIGSADVIDDSLTAADISGKASSGGNPAVNGTLTTNELKNGTVRSVDVFDDDLKAIDLAPNSVGPSELAADAVNGSKVLDDSLGGDDIDEASLGQVPNADTLDGIDSKGFARLGGVINGDGTIVQGTGFTVSRLNDGEYQVSFPAGTLSNSMCPPVVTVTPFAGIVRHPQLSGRSCSGLGAGSFTVKLLDNDAVAHDTPFLFIAM
jgi:hypothetical protein